MKAIYFLVLLMCSCIGLACDNPTVANIYTLQPGQTQIVRWDFTDCRFGIWDFRALITQPRNKQGFAAVLPKSTPITVRMVNLTTGDVAISLDNQAVQWFLNQNVSKGVVELTIIYGDQARKPLSILLDTVSNLGGPP